MLLQEDRYAVALAYMGGSMFLGLIAAALGVVLAKAL